MTRSVVSTIASAAGASTEPMVVTTRAAGWAATGAALDAAAGAVAKRPQERSQA